MLPVQETAVTTQHFRRMRKSDFDHAADARLSGAFAAAVFLHAMILSMPAGVLSVRAPNAFPKRTVLSAVLRAAAAPDDRQLSVLPQSKPGKSKKPLEQPRLSQPEALPEAPLASPQESQPEEAALPIGVPLAYYTTQELSQRPQPITTIPDFSLVPVTSPEPARLILRLFISDKGLVDRIQVENTELSKEQSDALKDIFLNTFFSPGLLENKPVPSQMRIEVLVEPFVQP